MCSLWLPAACIDPRQTSSNPWEHKTKSTGSIPRPCPSCLRELHPPEHPQPPRPGEVTGKVPNGLDPARHHQPGVAPPPGLAPNLPAASHREQREWQPEYGRGAGASRESQRARPPGFSRSQRWWEGKKRERGKKQLTQKPQGIFCLFRILGREKIATVIQSIRDNNSLFTVCMQRWQAGSTAQGRGMRNLLLSRHGPTASA